MKVDPEKRGNRNEMLRREGTASNSPSRHIIRLHSDENPYGCSLHVQEVLGASDHYFLPPDPVCSDLRAALSTYTGFVPERIVAGAGTVELTERMFHAYLDAGDGVIVCPPSLPQLNSGASRARVTLVQVPRTAFHDIDPDAILTAMKRQSNIKMVVLSSPNNPTGNITIPTTIVELLHTGVWVLVDESYFEFADRTAAPLVAEFDNLVVLRSFGPWAGLHGLPVGYALCSPRAAARLQRLSPPGSLNRAAQLAAIASLEDLDNLMQRVRRLRLERGRMYRQLRKLNLVQPFPSSGPFLLCEMRRGQAAATQHHLQNDGILVKQLSDRWLPNHLRIGIGKPEHTTALVASLRSLAANPHL